MSYVNTGYILGQQEARLAESNKPNNKTGMDQDAFLKILVAQLTHQDPMNPVEDKEMTAQLAQFSSLEQLTQINKGITSLTSAQDQNQIHTAVNYIGKHVKASGYSISKDGDTVSTLYYGSGESLAEVKVNIYDKDGAIVRTEYLGSKQAGSYEYVWDGKNDAGQLLPDGKYSIGILGEDTNGKPVMLQTEISGEVTGVVNDNGKSYLQLSDGRYVSFANIKEIVNPATINDSSNGQAGEDGNGNG